LSTGIPIGALLGSDMSEFDIAERFYWHTCQQASALARLAQLGVFDQAERAEREACSVS